MPQVSATDPATHPTTDGNRHGYRRDRLHDYGQYVRDAKNAGYDDVASFFEQVMQEDSQRASRCHDLMRELSGKEDIAQTH